MEEMAWRCFSTAAGGVHLMLVSFALPVVVKGISIEGYKIRTTKSRPLNLL